MKKTPLLLVLAGALLAVPAASAHVTVNPNEVPADSFSRFAIRVPNETEDAETTKITVQLPASVSFVSFQPKPGWKRSVTMVKLAKPVMLNYTLEERARAYLQGALLCRYDHPLTECKVMGAEIDRRLSLTQAP